jgi:hypothetical protein
MKKAKKPTKQAKARGPSSRALSDEQLEKVAGGGPTTAATATAVPNTGGSPTPYMQYDLTNTIVSGWSAGTGGEAPTESPATHTSTTTKY